MAGNGFERVSHTAAGWQAKILGRDVEAGGFGTCRRKATAEMRLGKDRGGEADFSTPQLTMRL
jgi:hypothetical protein